MNGQRPVGPDGAHGAGMVVRDLGKAYGDGARRSVVIEGCSFDIPAGRLTVMIGPSGCGKSTLIRLLAGFEAPTRGVVALDGRPILGPDHRRLVVFQESALFPWMTAEANIRFGPRARGLARAETADRTRGLLERVGLSAFAGRYPAQLSGGMQRRAELARALVNDPQVLILDEPFRGLDAMSRELMREYYASLFEETRRTQFFVTSDLDEAVFLADRLLVMTNAPMRVREVIDVPLPRPRRTADVYADDRANAIRARVLALLHEEAMRSFAGGSRAAADLVDAATRRGVHGISAPAARP